MKLDCTPKQFILQFIGRVKGGGGLWTLLIGTLVLIAFCFFLLGPINFLGTNGNYHIVSLEHPSRIYFDKLPPELWTQIAHLNTAQAEAVIDKTFRGKWIRLTGPLSDVNDHLLEFKIGEMKVWMVLANEEARKANHLNTGDVVTVEGQFNKTNLLKRDFASFGDSRVVSISGKATERSPHIEIWNWIWSNKEWLFSGVGVTLFLLLGRLLLRHRGNNSPGATCSAKLELSLDGPCAAGAGYGESQLVIAIRNTGKVTISLFRLDVEFPSPLLKPNVQYNLEMKDRGNSSLRFFRATNMDHKSKPLSIFSGDIKTLMTIPFQLDDRNESALDKKIRVELYSNDDLLDSLNGSIKELLLVQMQRGDI